MCRFPSRYENLYHVADLHMVNSFYTAKALYKHFDIKGHVFYPATPWDYYRSTPREWSTRDPIVAAAVDLYHIKDRIGWSNCSNSTCHVRIPEARLVVVGVPDPRYPQYYEKLKRLAEENEWLELIDKPLEVRQLARIYVEAKVYVHMRIGHFGMAPVEAMTQGTIPIIPRQTGLAEVVVEEKNGLLFENEQEAAEKILKVLSIDPKEGDRISEEARISSYYFTPTRFARQVLEYLKLISTLDD